MSKTDPCRSCVFIRMGQYHQDNECTIDKASINRPENIYWARTEYSDDDRDKYILSVWPCKYHITPDDVIFMIESKQHECKCIGIMDDKGQLVRNE